MDSSIRYCVLSTSTYGPGVEDLAQVQVDPEADGDEVGEEENKAEHVVVPGTVESLQDDHDQGQHHRSGKQHLHKHPKINMNIDQAFQCYGSKLILKKLQSHLELG